MATLRTEYHSPQKNRAKVAAAPLAARGLGGHRLPPMPRDALIAHQGELQLRRRNWGAITFILSTAAAISPFMAVLITAAGRMPDAGWMLLGGWLLAICIGAAPAAVPACFERRPRRVLDTLAIACACAQLAVPLATFVLSASCDSASRRCFADDSGTQVVAAQLTMLALSSIPSVLFRLPLLHALAPAFLLSGLEWIALATCSHGQPAELVAILCVGSTIWLQSVAFFAVSRREALERLSFDLLCEVAGGTAR